LIVVGRTRPPFKYPRKTPIVRIGCHSIPERARQSVRLSSLTFDPRTGFSGPLPGWLDSPSTLVLAFGTAECGDPNGPLRDLCLAFPNSTIVGCSTAGQIHGPAVQERGLAVAVARFERTRLRLATVALHDDSADAARQAAAALNQEGLRGIFALADGMRANGSEMTRAFSAAVPAGVAVSGGLAADGLRFERTWVLDRGVAREGMLAAVGFYGPDCRMGHGWRGGWDVFGPERLITRSSGSVLFELDGKPALDLYRMYLGERAEGLPATARLFPLALRSELPVADRTIRAAIGADPASMSLRFVGDLPEGGYVQLMHANADRLVLAATQASYRAASVHDGDGPVLAIPVSCAGRRLALGERAEDETEATLESLPPAATQVGFYGYGQLCPHPQSGCELNTQTLALTTVSEAA
jgi:hypothetical protein